MGNLYFKKDFDLFATDGKWFKEILKKIETLKSQSFGRKIYKNLH